MADKKKEADAKKTDAKKGGKAGGEEKAEQPVKRSRRWWKWLLVVVIILLIAAVAFAAGIYLKLFDMQAAAERWNLASYPVIGKYFNPPKTNFETVDLGPEPVLPPVKEPEAEVVLLPVQPQPQPPAGEIKKLDAAELQKMEKIKRQEEAKRIGKLARLYGEMKAEEAVLILNQLDDATVLAIFSKMEEPQVAKLLTTLDPKRAASLSQTMMKGANPVIN